MSGFFVSNEQAINDALIKALWLLNKYFSHKKSPNIFTLASCSFVFGLMVTNPCPRSVKRTINFIISYLWLYIIQLKSNFRYDSEKHLN